MLKARSYIWYYSFSNSRLLDNYAVPLIWFLLIPPRFNSSGLCPVGNDCPAKYRQVIFYLEVDDILIQTCEEISKRYDICILEIGTDGDFYYSLFPWSLRKKRSELSRVLQQKRSTVCIHKSKNVGWMNLECRIFCCDPGWAWERTTNWKICTRSGQRISSTLSWAA